ncbi:tryptophan 7-halogenase [Catenovulum sp. 2E275]|uniref:tryptophan halogenase family protein n=1 Tax=Catenovulum sp. 2E275 TaxID=2980497 RepID=UPI0021CE8DA3|nr:tryptophan halogenase family protein [Catenovulum sp. 2E275]MCU4675611.1 tryptophan 7-halogenase [Catenovulum sp. 2E275]
MQNKIKQIAIVGGGTAGWLTAGILASRLRTRINNGDIAVTLCESPNIPTVGVGEGTWPTMPSTLKAMGISETEFIRECDAAFKQGSKFVNWGQEEGDVPQYYYHPFDVPIAAFEGLLPEYWLTNPDMGSLAKIFSVQEALCENFKAPKNITHAEYAHAANYGYHLDAGKFAKLLQKHCTEKLSVKHILADVTEVELATDGSIDSVILDQGRTLSADLFIDCTGFKSLLLGQALDIKFKPVSDVLFADTAIATQVQYPDNNMQIKPYTQSTAQTAGWIWDIGLSSRRGVGHVFSSKHISAQQAQAELEQYIIASGADTSELNFRKIDFNSGYREKFWHKNCVAVGLSAGFLEPLEASALVLVELSAAMIAEQLPPTINTLSIVEKRFNQKFHYRWQRAIDFLKLHYILSQRQTQFWQDNRAETSIPSSLQELMLLWQHQVPKVSDFEATGELFQAPSFQFVLYGTHFRTEPVYNLSPAEVEFMQHQVIKNQKSTDNLLTQLPDHRSLINKIKQYGLAKV